MFFIQDPNTMIVGHLLGLGGLHSPGLSGPTPRDLIPITIPAHNLPNPVVLPPQY